MIVYPTENYNSWISEDDAFEYFEDRLNCSEWDSLTNKEPALITSFRSIQELTLDIIFDDNKVISTAVYTTSEAEAILRNLQYAQVEQCLHELQNDLDIQQLDFLSLSGLTVKMPKDSKPERFSSRALAILRPYIIARTVTRFR